MERTLLRDKDWAAIDGRLCLVTNFVPLLAKVENGKVLDIDLFTPYASVDLKCENSTEDITGFITHKMDFAMLWAAFKHRTEVPGTRIKIYSPEFNPDGLGENEEVWLVWTRKHYKFAAARLFKLFMPKLIVMVSPKGAFELWMDHTIRPDLHGIARVQATLPLVTWTPEVMDL